MGNLLGTIFGPIGTIFNAIFYGPIYNVLMLIYNLIHAIGVPGALGLSIIALTLLVRCCMIPLTRKQLKSSRAMQELAPQINALKVQYRGDPQGLMKAQQDLYKEHGYSPVSGCLPLLIQMPFLYALLFSFRTLLTVSKNQAVILKAINKPIYPFLPHLTAIPNPSFLWVDLRSSRSVAYSAVRGCSLHAHPAAHGDAGPQEAGSRYTYRSDACRRPRRPCISCRPSRSLSASVSRPDWRFTGPSARCLLQYNSISWLAGVRSSSVLKVLSISCRRPENCRPAA